MLGKKAKHAHNHQAQILMTRPAPETKHCLDELEAYCLFEINEGQAAQQFPHIAAHLANCTSCAAAYAALYSVLGTGDDLHEPNTHHFDLNRLTPPNATFETTQLRGLTQSLNNAVERIGEQVWVHIPQALAEHPPSTIEPNHWELHLTELSDQVEDLQMKVIPSSNAFFCQIRIHIGLHGYAWPDLHGTNVRLRSGNDEQHALTDAWGEVIFHQIAVAALDHIALVIEPTDK